MWQEAGENAVAVAAEDVVEATYSALAMGRGGIRELGADRIGIGGPRKPQYVQSHRSCAGYVLVLEDSFICRS